MILEVEWMQSYEMTEERRGGLDGGKGEAERSGQQGEGRLRRVLKKGWRGVEWTMPRWSGEGMIEG